MTNSMQRNGLGVHFNHFPFTKNDISLDSVQALAIILSYAVCQNTIRLLLPT